MRWLSIILPCAPFAATWLALSCLIASAPGEDWPMYGRDATHNGVVLKGAPPTDWQVGEFDRKSGAWHREKSRNVKWVANLGRVTFGDPVVAGGLVWVGTNNGHGQNIEDASVLACFRESDGKLLYRYLSPRLPGGLRHDWPLSSMACSPLIEGDRMWFTTNRCETVSLDIGPLKRGESPPRELWKVDLMQQYGVRPCGLARYMGRASSVVAYRDLIYVITGNGMDGYSAAITAPEAPSVICFQKESGEVLWKDHSPGANILTGQRGSPLVIDAGDRAQVVVPQGDGWLRSFEPLTGKLLWKFDINFKTSKKLSGKPYQAASRYWNGACDWCGASRLSKRWSELTRTMHALESMRRS
jgi:outer membrane protein assembly factor BamB